MGATRCRAVCRLDGDNSGNGCRGDRRMIHHPVDQGFDANPDPTPNLNPNPAGPTVTMWAAKHRQAAGEPVSPRRRHSSRDSFCFGVSPLQQDRTGERAPVTIPSPDRIGEPRKVPAGTAAPQHPLAISPITSVVFERMMMLAGARRSRGSRSGNVDGINRVELIGGVPGKEAAEAGAESCADHQGSILIPGQLVEGKQFEHFLRVIADGNHMAAGGQHGCGKLGVVPRWCCQDGDVRRIGGVGCTGHRFDPPVQGATNRSDPLLVHVEELYLGNVWRAKLSGEM